jgi:hypothetical protein
MLSAWSPGTCVFATQQPVTASHSSHSSQPQQSQQPQPLCRRREDAHGGAVAGAASWMRRLRRVAECCSILVCVQPQPLCRCRSRRRRSDSVHYNPSCRTQAQAHKRQHVPARNPSTRARLRKKRGELLSGGWHHSWHLFRPSVIRVAAADIRAVRIQPYAWPCNQPDRAARSSAWQPHGAGQPFLAPLDGRSWDQMGVCTFM